ncbi:MAG: sugar ABC transporter permease, partial [Elusimicrobia bacterium]|nr:sugar ABC transporter permease [Elusimicrobiota bacterium]
MLGSLLQVLYFVALGTLSVAVLEGYLYLHFRFWDKRWLLPIGLLAAVAAGCSAAALVPLGRASLIVSAIATEACLCFVIQYLLRGRFTLPYLLLAPAVIGLLLLIVYPLAFEVSLAFHDLKLNTVMHWSRTGELPFVGVKQFARVFTTSPLSEVTFWQLLLRTLWWTVINVVLHVTGGFALALLLNEVKILRGVYRTLLVIPWAMPQVVAVLALRGEFQAEFGAFNIMLSRLDRWLPWVAKLGIGPVQWLGRHPFLTCTLINVWLGIPFMMVVILGGLQSISRNYYDAAAIDGASAFQQFRMITLPLIKPVLVPAVTLGAVWTFNNINVIYLVTGQAGGSEGADILVSALYKSAVTYYRYSYSAAFAI